MNVSKLEQRILHALAQGATIRHHKNDEGRLIAVDCATREGWILSDCTLDLFLRLKRRRMIASRGGAPYRITRAGLDAVRAQLNTR
jgi:uncharacterized protein YjhX (UPF0386 family)